MEEFYKARAEIAKALGHPLRLKLVEIIEDRGKECVCELTDLVEASQPTVSKHLKKLKDAGIVHSNKEGMRVYYEVQTPCINQFFSCVDKILTADLERKQEQLSRK